MSSAEGREGYGEAQPKAASPVVSVIIPAYNAEATVGETLDSARAQSEPRIEILVVDDGSTDKTSEIVSAIAATDPRVRLICQANAGVAAARNAGLAEARGRFAAWLDADDLWHPTKLARQIAVFDAAPAPPAFVYTGYRLIDASDRVIPNPRTLADLSGETLCRQIATTYFTNVSSIMAPVALARACGGHDPGLRAAGIEGAEDLLFQLRLALRGPCGCVRAALVGYRMHGANMSRAVARAARSNARALELIRAEAPEVPEWVFRLGRARMVGFAFQTARAGDLFDATRQLGGLLRGQPGMTAAMLGRIALWLTASAAGRRPRDPDVGRTFRDTEPDAVPWEGPMLLSESDANRLARADTARASRIAAAPGEQD
jgi:hypothetical protein